MRFIQIPVIFLFFFTFLLVNGNDNESIMTHTDLAENLTHLNQSNITSSKLHIPN